MTPDPQSAPPEALAPPEEIREALTLAAHWLGRLHDQGGFARPRGLAPALSRPGRDMSPEEQREALAALSATARILDALAEAATPGGRQGPQGAAARVEAWLLRLRG